MQKKQGSPERGVLLQEGITPVLSNQRGRKKSGRHKRKQGKIKKAREGKVNSTNI